MDDRRPPTPLDFETSEWIPLSPRGSRPAAGQSTGQPAGGSPGQAARPADNRRSAARPEPHRTARAGQPAQGGRPAQPPFRTARAASAGQPAQTAARPPLTARQQRAAARRVRERRRRQQQLFLAATLVVLMVLAGIITALLPKSVNLDPTNSVSLEKPALSTLLAPLPYNGAASGGSSLLDWGLVGPTPQTPDADTPYTYTAAPTPPAALPACGRVTTEWFSDAAFLGDSLTAGLSVYGIDVGGALVCGYEGASPNQIVNRVVLNDDDRGDEIPLDVLAAAQPAKLYILMGTNALVGEGDTTGFLNYYARMLDELRAVLPHTTFFVQALLPVRPEALDRAPGLNSARLAEVNAALQALCAERGCLFLDLNAEFSGEDGALLAEYAQPDGIHLTVSGYSKWVGYLSTHVPYSKDNPWQAGSTWYLDENVRQLLSDLP